MELAYLILPDCLLVATGWFLRNNIKFTPEFFNGLEKLVYFLLFPALLIYSIITTPITLSKAGNLLAICFLLAFLGYCLVLLLKKYLQTDSTSISSGGQCAYRFNSYIGLSLAPSIAGQDSLATMAILIGFSVPIVNILAVYSIAKQQGGRVLSELFKNPLVISTLIGLTLNLSGLSLPTPLTITLHKLGQSTIPLGLICVGAALMLRAGARQTALILWLSAIRLLIMPILAIALAFIFGLSMSSSQTLLLFSALPTATASYILAVRMGGNGLLVASIISIGTVISVVTLPLWLGIGHIIFPLSP